MNHPAVLSHEGRKQLLLKGDLLVQRRVPAMRKLCECAMLIASDVFRPFHPEYAHQDLSFNDYMECLNTLMKVFSENLEVKKTIQLFLIELGIKLDDTFCDRFVLRILPPKLEFQQKRAKKLWAHRDSWCSNVYQQINLWGPIYPISKSRTITIFPEYWLKPIQNNSATWDIAKLRECRQLRKNFSYPSIPNTLEDVTYPGVPVVIEPGDILGFSGAHLHESTVADFSRARVSFDFRLVSLTDIKLGIKAPNFDGKAVNRNFSWFSRFTDQVSLEKVLAAKNFEELD